MLTDDQDTASLEHMPKVQREIVGEGTTFGNAVFSDPLCCPSRTSMLTGRYPHNHGVTSNDTRDDAERLFSRGGLASSTYATWLKRAGYRTAYVGKYLNGYDSTRVMPGRGEWYAPTENARYGGVNDNGKMIQTSAENQDTLFVDRALDFIDEASPKPAPFLMTVSFHSPHVPAAFEKKYADDFEDAELPRSPNFDEEDRSDKPNWLRNSPVLSGGTIAKMQVYYRNRLRSLQTVDEGVAEMVASLKDAGDLDNTYIFFYTDNGFHLGSHADKGKSTPYEEDVNFPLIVRGPGVPAGANSEALVMNNDVAPTLADLADARTQHCGRALDRPLVRRDGTPQLAHGRPGGGLGQGRYRGRPDLQGLEDERPDVHRVRDRGE